MTENLYSVIQARLTDADKTFMETPDGRAYSYGDLDARSYAHRREARLRAGNERSIRGPRRR